MPRLLLTGSDSGNTKNPNKKFIPARNADIKNGALGEISPKRPPIRGPKINPIPNAAPISPKFLALSFSEDKSARYAVAVGIVDPVIPAISFPKKSTHKAPENPRII